MSLINKKIENFTANAYYKNQIKSINLDSYKGKWLVLFFYPGDFTFVCPTELGELADNYKAFQDLNAEILSISTDSEFVHKAWHDNSETIKKIEYPMLADPTGKISKLFDVYIEEEGVALRGTFIINPEGILKVLEIHNNGIGRSSEELLRKLDAAKFVHENEGLVCPASWKPGKKTLKPGLDLVGKL